MLRSFVAVLTAAALATGCLSQSYIIPKKDLRALAQTPPEQRGQHVRVRQAFEGEDAPPAAPRVDSGTAVVIVAPGPRHVHRVPAHRHHNAPSAKNESDKAWFWVVVAIAVGIGLAATEGARYDGWVQLNPMHPVHLYGPMGEYTWVPLAQLDPQTAEWAQKAIVRPNEGPWRPLGRAPLDRRGWAYSILLGSAQMPSVYGNDKVGFMSHIQIGGFPDHHLGVMLDIGLGWAQNDIGATIFDSRWGLELQLMPVDAGPFHAGLFGQGGLGSRIEDGPKDASRQGVIYGGGALLQLELTTHLTLTGRAGLTRTFGSTVADITGGISVY